MGSIECTRRIPGPTSFWEVGFIAPDQLFFRKVFRPVEGLSLHMDNRNKPLSGPGATRKKIVSDRETKAEPFLTRPAPTKETQKGSVHSRHGPLPGSRRQRLADAVRPAAGHSPLPRR